MRHVFERQVTFVKDFVAVQVGERDLGGGQHVESGVGVLINRVGKLGQLRRAFQHLRRHHQGNVNLLVAVPVRLVEEEVDEGLLQAGAGAFQYVAAAAGELDAAFQVEDAEGRRQFPVRQGRDVKFAEVAFRRRGAIVVFAGSDRHARVRQVGQPEHLVAQFRFGRLRISVWQIAIYARPVCHAGT